VTAVAALRGKRVVLTRPERGELGEHLAALGADVLHVPLIEVLEPADGGARLQAALGRLAEFDWLVVTSPTGARQVGVAARAVPAVRLAAVGPATASTLTALAGRPVDIVPATARAEGLLEELPPPPARILLAQADQARPVLAEGLARAGHDVESVVAYRTVERHPSPGEVAEMATADAVVLASGSAARAMARAIAATGVQPTIVCIGPVTADAARAVGLRVDHVAAHPDPSTLTNVVAGALA
jgi:uroporphyrinogen-III synthase